jgi:N-acetylglucosaminyl-diphospho-decaprenol L-rhamnosyltransferase
VTLAPVADSNPLQPVATGAPGLSVIVLNYNGRRWLRPCLDALADQRGAPRFEVVVVDNASTDGSADAIREYEREQTAAPQSSAFEGLRLLETGANLGFAAGNNAGARIARGSLLAFLNNDTVVEPDWLARLHAALETRPQFAMATSRLVFLDDPAVVDSAGDGYLRAGGAFKHGYGGPASRALVSREVFGACGGAFLVRRAVYDALGGFDERFFMVYEDVDLSYRARLLGHRCWYAADAVVRHAGSGTLGVASPAAVFYGQRNLEWTWFKNTPTSLLVRTAIPHILYSSAGLLHYARTGRLIPALRGKVAAMLGLGAVMKDRRAVRHTAVVDARTVEQMMDRGWLALKRREKAARIAPSPK